MRVRFRISLLKGGRRLKKRDLKDLRDPLHTGMRYVVEFKYLEATKWLLIAEDSWEKYALLSLINLSLGQEDQAFDFLNQSQAKERVSDYTLVVENPERGIREVIDSPSDLRRLFSQTLPC